MRQSQLDKRIYKLQRFPILLLPVPHLIDMNIPDYRRVMSNCAYYHSVQNIVVAKGREPRTRNILRIDVQDFTQPASFFFDGFTARGLPSIGVRAEWSGTQWTKIERMRNGLTPDEIWEPVSWVEIVKPTMFTMS